MHMIPVTGLHYNITIHTLYRALPWQPHFISLVQESSRHKDMPYISVVPRLHLAMVWYVCHIINVYILSTSLNLTPVNPTARLSQPCHHHVNLVVGLTGVGLSEVDCNYIVIIELKLQSVLLYIYRHLLCFYTTNE